MERGHIGTAEGAQGFPSAPVHCMGIRALLTCQELPHARSGGSMDPLSNQQGQVWVRLDSLLVPGARDCLSVSVPTPSPI